MDITFKVTELVEQWICITFCIKLEHSSMETIQMIQKAVAMSNWWLAASSHHTHSCIRSHAEFFGEIPNHTGDSAPYSPDLASCDFWLFPKLKSPLKGKRFQTVNEIEENITGQLMLIGGTVWGPKVPTLKRTEVLLFYVQCFFYLVSSINVSVFHTKWLDTLWTEPFKVFLSIFYWLCYYATFSPFAPLHQIPPSL